MSTDLNAIHEAEHKHLVKRVLELAARKLRTDGWWGFDAEGEQKFSHKNRIGCKCAALQINEACIELGVDNPTRDAANTTFASVIKSPTDDNDPFWQIARWNDVPTRHVATVKRAFDRAIARVA